MPTMCTPVNTIVNQLTMARKYATAPSSPPSAPIDSELCSLDPIVPPSAAPPTRMMCGIARKNRKNVVRRSRFVSAGCTVTVTGYAIATSPNHQITLSVNDEFEEVAVWIADVGARPVGLASALARHGPF